ncbi:MAG: hypothetical protein LBQ44_02240 [Treponema sp.]|nr:hypothetical protein [Treponema sp.]
MAEILLLIWDGSCGEGREPRTPQKQIRTYAPPLVSAGSARRRSKQDSIYAPVCSSP